MIRDYQRYFGSALTLLIDSWDGPLKIRKSFGDKNGYYLLEERLPLAIKFSRSRTGPWSFTYHLDHQRLYAELVRVFGNCVTAYVCGTDGIVAVEHRQLRQFLDDVFEEQESVSIRRKLKHMYSIKGRNGTLDKKVARDSYVKLVRELLNP